MVPTAWPLTPLSGRPSSIEHSTRQEESSQEVQPCRLESGAVLTWDGRLDNRAEFIGLMRHRLSQDSSDVAIVAAAYERWGTDCFARLLGDWALTVWSRVIGH